MAAIEAVTRKWGNSLGITIPQKVIRQINLRENQRIIIDIKPKPDLSPLRGMLRSAKSTQQLKDEMRQGWE
ncbi:AbrB/MazE/SpoVT family DNA-binding domain-containing protein [Candidatus Woesearchaeota archaeon]|nr:AbrB/MazE/SpoVT family DNA-binding domain-containing protein [Candidatus Woesearchaeota archaeon]